VAKWRTCRELGSRRSGEETPCVSALSSQSASLSSALSTSSSAIAVPFLEFNARAANFFLNFFGTNTRVDGVFVLGGDFRFWVSAECTSTIFTAIFASAAIAWPSTIREKLIGIFMGATVLFVINLVRIVSLYYIGSDFPGFFDLAHFFLWQIVLILLTVGLWMLWMEKMVHKPEKTEQRTEPKRLDG
jgi:archaeosortase B (VPXXXP-CTERM-specific)